VCPSVHDPQHHGRGVIAGGDLKTPGRDHDAHIDNDGHTHLDGHRQTDEGKEAKEATQPHRQAVDPGVAQPGAEGLPAWMANVDGGGEAGAQHCRHHRADSIDDQGVS